MSKICYEPRTFRDDTAAVVAQAEEICADYDRRGYELTLRQLYYQFVARGLLPNSDRSYKRLGDVVNNARLAGLIDWYHIVDRTRAPSWNSHWDTTADVMRSAAAGFAVDKWEGQPRRVEVWVEKEALAGIISAVAGREDCPWFACRGYVSQSAMWQAAQRIRYRDVPTTILHLGDHDPSGIDMTRDITDRLTDFLAHHLGGYEGIRKLEVQRIALNMDQVREFNPPPNPAKLTDSRGSSYVEEYGDESWELDALSPEVLDQLITGHILDIRDPDQWEARRLEELDHRALLRTASDRWADVTAFLNGGE